MANNYANTRSVTNSIQVYEQEFIDVLRLRSVRYADTIQSAALNDRSTAAPVTAVRETSFVP